MEYDFSFTAAEVASVGDQLLLTTVATDNNDVTGPGVGRSEEMPLQISADDVVRRELDRLLAQARERSGQARDVLRQARREDNPTLVGRSLAVVRRIDDHVSEVVRRWQLNQFPEEEVVPG